MKLRLLANPSFATSTRAAARNLSSRHSFKALARTRVEPRKDSCPLVPQAVIRSTVRCLATMAKPKVLLLGEIDHAHDTWNSLSELAELIEPKSQSREEFIKESQSGGLDGVVAAYRTFGSVTITGIWDEELVQALPASLKLVAHNGAGYDQLKVAPLTQRRVLATNTPTAVDDATADTALYLLIGALRNFGTSQLALRQHAWRGDPPPALGHDPQGKLLGILGLGGIGRNLARKCRALGMEIAYHNRNRLAPALEEGARYLSFDELLAQSDVLSVHVPLNDKTRHLVDAAALKKVKRGCVIVNTARGAVIDEAALVDALESGQVGCVGLDVYEEEPAVHEGLLRNERAVLLPHMGTWTRETQEAMEIWCMNNVRNALLWLSKGETDKGKDLSVVPEQKDLWQEMLNEGSR